MTGAVIVFDIDGTLMDHGAAAGEGLDSFLHLIGAEPTPSLGDAWLRAEQERFTAWREGKVSFAEQWRLRMANLFEVLGKPVSGEAQPNQFFGSYLAEYERAWQVYPDVPSCLEELCDRGFEMVVFRNGDDQQQNIKLERIGVCEYFSCVLTADSLGNRQASSGDIRQGSRGAGFRGLGAHLRRRRPRTRCAGCARCWLADVPPGPVRHQLRPGLHQVVE